MKTALAAALAATVILAGCLDVADSARDDASVSASGHDAPASRDDAWMTARENVEEKEGLADPRSGPFGVYAAERIITVDGEMRLDVLPVLLDTRNGNVHVTATDDPEAWRLVIHLTGHGASPEDARAARESMTASWAHEVDGRHVVHALVEFDRLDDHDGPVNVGVTHPQARADVTLELPATVVAALDAETRNGNVRAAGLEATNVALETRNGNVIASDVRTTTAKLETRNGNAEFESGVARTAEVEARNGNAAIQDARVTNAEAITRNGNAHVDVTPAEDGRVVAKTRNGNAEVVVPETDANAYDAHAVTRNGKASTSFRDGTSSKSDDGTEATFRTRDYEVRDVKTEARAESRNGNAAVGAR